MAIKDTKSPFSNPFFSSENCSPLEIAADMKWVTTSAFHASNDGKAYDHVCSESIKAISVCFQTIKAQVHVGTCSPSSKLTSPESRVLWLWILVRQDYGCQYLGLPSNNWSEGVAATPSGRNFRHPYRVRNFIYPHFNSPLALFQTGIVVTALLNASDMSAELSS